MKTIRSCILLLLLFLLTGCSKLPDQRYVKNVFFSFEDDKYNIVVEYYDFSSETENYIHERYSGNDIFKLAIEAVKEGNYNFRLCENCFVSAELFIDKINKIINTINSIKIPPGVNIVCYISDETDSEKFINTDLTYTPLYNLSNQENTVNGIIQIADKNGRNYGAIFIKDGQPAKVVNEKQWMVFNIITGEADSLVYDFRNGELLALLENINTFYYVEDDILNIKINMTLKDYKGIQNSIKSKNLFVEFLKDDIENTVFELYDDISISSVYNLHWYCRQKGKICTDLNIDVTIM